MHEFCSTKATVEAFWSERVPEMNLGIEVTMLMTPESKNDQVPQPIRTILLKKAIAGFKLMKLKTLKKQALNQ